MSAQVLPRYVGKNFHTAARNKNSEHEWRLSKKMRTIRGMGLCGNFTGL